MTELVIRLLLIYLKGRNVSTQLRETGKRALLRQAALELGRAHHSARENRRGPGESLAVFSSNDGCRAIVRHGGAEFHSGKGVFSAEKRRLRSPVGIVRSCGLGLGRWGLKGGGRSGRVCSPVGSCPMDKHSK